MQEPEFVELTGISHPPQYPALIKKQQTLQKIWNTKKMQIALFFLL